MANAYNYSSTAGTYTLTGSISNSATSLALSSVTGLPASLPFKVVIDPGQGTEEIVKVTAVAGTTLTVTRGWDGSAAAAHAAGAQVRHMMTAEDLTLSRTHEDSTAAHGATGAVVGTTNAQSLTNKDLTSGTNTFPSSLATDAEVSSSVSTGVSNHAALTTGVHGVGAGAVVGTTLTQTLTNKTYDTPTITGTATAATGDVVVGDPASSTERRVRTRRKSTTTAVQGEAHLYVSDSAGESRATVALYADAVEKGRLELTNAGELKVTTGPVLGQNDSAWQNFTPTVYTNMTGTPAAISATVQYARYRRSGNTIFAHASVDLNAGTANGVGISLPVTASIRELTCGTCALFGTGTPSDQSGIAYMASDKAKLVVVAYTQGFRDGTAGQTIRYSVTYEV